MNFRLVFRVTGQDPDGGGGLHAAAPAGLPDLPGGPRPLPAGHRHHRRRGAPALPAPHADDHFFPREGFFAVGLIWLLVGACGALPFYFCGSSESYVDCFFECGVRLHHHRLLHPHRGGAPAPGHPVLALLHPLAGGHGGAGAHHRPAPLPGRAHPPPDAGGEPRPRRQQAGAQGQPVLQDPLRHLLRHDRRPDPAAAAGGHALV